jgi:hypothetical protein
MHITMCFMEHDRVYILRWDEIESLGFDKGWWDIISSF